MAIRRALALLTLGAVVCTAQWNSRSSGSGGRRWAQYEGEIQTPMDDPPDAWVQREFAFARLRYRSPRGGGYYQRWGIDCNRADRHFLQALQRLTRVDANSVEQIVDIDSNEMYQWPFLYAVAAGDWVLSDSQAARLGDFLRRGGFLMVDDFHGQGEWASFMAGMSKALPEGQVIDLADDHPMFQTLFDLSRRVRVPGYNVVHGGQVERGGVDPHWRAIIDPNGRALVAICFNMDLGDAYEFADDADYPEEYASMAFRMGVNYVLYALTH